MAKRTAKKREYTFIDLFAGAGGLSEGFMQMGFKPIAHVEMNPYAAKTLETITAYYYLKSKKNEDKAYQELAGLKECISLLLRMSREKMIEVEDAAFKSDAGTVLIQGNYCDEVIMDGSGKHYYSLSDKAEKVLKSKNFIGKIKKDNVSAIVPSGLILTAEKWSNLYARRIELLRNYYSKKREGEEYILFTLDESKKWYLVVS